jgi:hypothetical protein
MKKLMLGLAACALLAAPATTLAGPIPYDNPGTENPDTYTFIAGGGEITAYFYGSTAAYGSEIGLLVNNLSTGVQGLYNQTSSYGDTLVLATDAQVSPGDILVFQLFVETDGGLPAPGDHILYSDKSMNADLMQHIYSTAFVGDAFIPAGTYVGFEDILGTIGNDLDYDDHQFVFTGIATVPDGGSALALLGVALTGLGMIRRRLS